MTPIIRTLSLVSLVFLATCSSVAYAGFWSDLFSGGSQKKVPEAQPAKAQEPKVRHEVVIINNNPAPKPVAPVPVTPPPAANQPSVQAENKPPAPPTQTELNEMLWLASLQGNDGRIRGLVEQGADPKSGTRFGETPLHVAASRGHLKPIIYLANHGGAINARTSNGWTPLHHAARFGHYDAVRYLLHMGAIPHIRTNDKGRKTPMEMAVDNGYLDIAVLFGYRPPNK